MAYKDPVKSLQVPTNTKIATADIIKCGFYTQKGAL